MASLNKVMLIGNVTRSRGEVHPKGSAVVILDGNQPHTNQAGEKVDEVTYVDVELWTPAETPANIKKGRPIFIEGRLRMDSGG
jgi:single-stranded DNA-binding protein